jgi:hypothetical protein
MRRVGKLHAIECDLVHYHLNKGGGQAWLGHLRVNQDHGFDLDHEDLGRNKKTQRGDRIYTINLEMHTSS